MNDIISPHCSKAFKIDETGYADILKQVRDSDFEHQLHEQLSPETEMKVLLGTTIGTQGKNQHGAPC